MSAAHKPVNSRRFPAEQKLDPDDGKLYTFEELKAKYAQDFNEDEVLEFWKFDCKSVADASAPSPSSSSTASPPKVAANDQIRAATDRRTDPDDGKMYTYAEFVACNSEYGYSRKEIDEYWKETMVPNAAKTSSNSEPPGLRASSAAVGSDPNERRVDPEDDQVLTFKELEAKLKDNFSPSEIREYWEEDCSVASLKAASPAPAKASASSTSVSVGAEAIKVDTYDGARLTFKEVQDRYKGDFTAEEIQEYWDQEMAPLPSSSPSSAITHAHQMSASTMDLKSMTFREWLDSLDAEWQRLLPENGNPGASGIKEFLTTLEEQYDSFGQILELYLNKGGSSGKSILSDDFFNDIGIQKLGQKRLINQWIGKHT